MTDRSEPILTARSRNAPVYGAAALHDAIEEGGKDHRDKGPDLWKRFNA